MRLLFVLFIRKKKHLLENIFGSHHTSNWIYLLQNCFSNYAYLKDMYITLKGIEKILFVLVLTILLICKCLSFMAAFTEKKNFPKFAFNFLCEKVNNSWIIHELMLPFIAFEEYYYVLKFCQLSIKVTFKKTVKIVIIRYF